MNTLQPTLWSRWIRPLAGALALALLAACSPEEPVRIGFIGNISGRGGRNGVQLAVELRNAAGGIGGQPVELMVRDDGNDEEHARGMFREMVRAGAGVVIGPMTSAMALALAPEAERSGVVLLSPTVTTNELSGKDDHFFRVVSPTRDYSAISARHLVEHRGARTLAVIYDARNASYSSSWLGDFRESFEDLGGRVVKVISFESGPDEHFVPLAEDLLAERTDAILLIANSLDAALLAQQIRKLDTRVVIAASEWAGTERLIEIGGRAVEGIALARFIDAESTAPAWLEFRERFIARFGSEPGFAGLTGFDAANVALEALTRKAPDTSLRDYLKRHPEVAGAQGPFQFDPYGDSQRPSFLTTIENGRFVLFRDAR